jgi:hypothetical protein
VLSAYRTSVHPATGETPFFLLYGRDPVLPDQLVFQDNANADVSISDFVKDITVQMQQVYQNVHERQAARAVRAKKYHDKKFGKKSVEFLAGDKVYVFFEASWDRYGSGKFASRWSGPYRILTKLSELDYICRHTLTNHELTVHVDRIRKMKESDKPRAWKRDMVEAIDHDQDHEYEVEAIEDRRWSEENYRWEWLVKWTGYEERTWEPIEVLGGANLHWYHYQDENPYPSDAHDKPRLKTQRRTI